MRIVCNKGKPKSGFAVRVSVALVDPGWRTRRPVWARNPRHGHEQGMT